MTNTKHKTKLVEFGNYSEQIDAEISLLIQELWKGGMNTRGSCQGESDEKIWIQFDCPNDVTLFLATALCTGTLTEEIFNDTHPDGWEICSHPYYITYDDEDRPGETYDIIELATCVYFPKAHLNKVLKVIKWWNNIENSKSLNPINHRKLK